MDKAEHVWAVVLTCAEALPATMGSARTAVTPEAYQALGGRASMFRAALGRALRLTAPERVVTVVLDEHRPYWEPELAEQPRCNIAVQPCDRGSATAVLFAVTDILRRDPAAVFAFVPATHTVSSEAPVDQALHRALQVARTDARRAVLLGMLPSGRGGEHRWILPSASVAGPSLEVLRLTTPPSPRTAQRLWEQGAYWNTMTFVAARGALLRLFDRELPGLVRAFDVYRRMGDPWKPWVLEALYEVLPRAELAADLFEPAAELLRVVPVLPCGFVEIASTSRAARCVARSKRVAQAQRA
jgi:mannose-1-phosphate guanylyltransferase